MTTFKLASSQFKVALGKSTLKWNKEKKSFIKVQEGSRKTSEGWGSTPRDPNNWGEYSGFSLDRINQQLGGGTGTPGLKGQGEGILTGM